MAVAANICVAWPSTVGSIPSGWVRETSLDSRYILGASTGADTDLSTDRGATTHSHTSPSHNPTQNAHTHNFTGLSPADTSLNSGTAGGGAGADVSHGHDAKASNATTATNNGVAITVNATSNDLAFLEVIWIKSDGTPATLPSGCLAFFASDSLPSGWSRVQADRYLKGAGTGADGGATGGANTHTHTSPAHTHTQNVHNHGTTTSNISNFSSVGKGVGSDTVSAPGHTHAISIDVNTATNQPVTTTIDPANHEPPFKKLNTVQTAGASLPTNIIALWLGTNAGIPANWTRFTSMDGLWLKGAATDGESNNTTGGGTSHMHTASDCQPTQDAHTHSYTDPGSVGSTSSVPGTQNDFAGAFHGHTWTIDTTVATNNAVSVTIDANTVNSALPKHRTVIYVQFTGSAPVRPPVTITSYDLNLFSIGDPYTGLLPEAEHRIAAGDLRHLPR